MKINIALVSVIVVLVLLLVGYWLIDFGDVLGSQSLSDHASASQPQLLSLYVRSALPAHDAIEVAVAYDAGSHPEPAVSDFFFDPYSTYAQRCVITIRYDTGPTDPFVFCDAIALESHIAAGRQGALPGIPRHDRSLLNSSLISAYRFESASDASLAYEELESHYSLLEKNYAFHRSLTAVPDLDGVLALRASYLVAANETLYVHVAIARFNATVYHLKSISQEPVLRIGFEGLIAPYGSEYLGRLRKTDPKDRITYVDP